MNLIAKLSKRVEALEKLVLQTPQQKRRLSKAKVAVREDVTERTLDRRVAQGVFPPPDIVNGRCYWWEHVLEAHDAARARMVNEKHPAVKVERRKRIAVAREHIQR